jgi:ligand-binding sensor domain-containing protein
MKLAFLFLLFIQTTVGFSVDVRFKNIPSLELLLKETVWSLENDHNGNLLIGSNSGLLLYDGYKTSTITQKNSNENIGNVRKLLTDKEGVTWIGTRGNGLFRLKENQLEKFTSNNKVEAPLNITAIKENNKGLWIGTDES